VPAVGGHLKVCSVHVYVPVRKVGPGHGWLVGCSEWFLRVAAATNSKAALLTAFVLCVRDSWLQRTAKVGSSTLC